MAQTQMQTHVKLSAESNVAGIQNMSEPQTRINSVQGREYLMWLQVEKRLDRDKSWYLLVDKNSPACSDIVLQFRYGYERNEY